MLAFAEIVSVNTDMYTFPRLFVVINPDSETVAIERSLDSQLRTGSVTVLPSSSCADAYSCAVSPMLPKRIRVAERVITVGFWRTTTDALATKAPERATTVVEPFLIEVIRPDFETVAI